MPTKLIHKFDEKKICKHPEHKAPMWVVYEPGIYEHTCPNCGESYKFTVRPKPSLETKESIYDILTDVYKKFNCENETPYDKEINNY
jgi:transcription elongation factor Elf1